MDVGRPELTEGDYSSAAFGFLALRRQRGWTQMDADEKSNQTILLNKVRFDFLQCLRPSAKSASICVRF